MIICEICQERERIEDISKVFRYCFRYSSVNIGSGLYIYIYIIPIRRDSKNFINSLFHIINEFFLYHIYSSIFL